MSSCRTTLLELASIAHESYLLSGGKVVAAGTPRELKESSLDVVRQFMEGSAEGPVPFHYPAPDYETELLAVEDP